MEGHSDLPEGSCQFSPHLANSTFSLLAPRLAIEGFPSSMGEWSLGARLFWLYARSSEWSSERWSPGKEAEGHGKEGFWGHFMSQPKVLPGPA